MKTTTFILLIFFTTLTLLGIGNGSRGVLAISAVEETPESFGQNTQDLSSLREILLKIWEQGPKISKEIFQKVIEKGKQDFGRVIKFISQKISQKVKEKIKQKIEEIRKRIRARFEKEVKKTQEEIEKELREKIEAEKAKLEKKLREKLQEKFNEIIEKLKKALFPESSEE